MRPIPSRSRRRASTLAVIGLLTLAGCTHNHYYTAMPGCAEPTVIAAAPEPMGAICEPADAAVSSSVVTVRPRAQSVVTKPRSSRVIITEPAAPISSTPRAGSKLSWRRNDPDAQVTTRIDGALDDDPVRR